MCRVRCSELAAMAEDRAEEVGRLFVQGRSRGTAGREVQTHRRGGQHRRNALRTARRNLRTAPARENRLVVEQRSTDTTEHTQQTRLPTHSALCHEVSTLLQICAASIPTPTALLRVVFPSPCPSAPRVRRLLSPRTPPVDVSTPVAHVRTPEHPKTAHTPRWGAEFFSSTTTTTTTTIAYRMRLLPRTHRGR